MRPLSDFDIFALGEIMEANRKVDPHFFRTVYTFGLTGASSYSKYGNVLQKYSNQTGDPYHYQMVLSDLTAVMLIMKFFQRSSKSN